MIATKQFQPFKRRIQLLRAIEGAFTGIAVGAAIGIVWAILDWRGVVYLEWLHFGLMLLACAIIGASIRVFRRIDDLSVARSIDRRAKLKDRLGTSAEIQDDSVFSQLLAEDASSHLNGLSPKALYPMRAKKIHMFSILGIAAVALIVFFANTKIFLPKEALAAKESMQKESKRLEELRKAIFDDPNDKQITNAEMMALQKDLQKLQKDYEKARIDPKEAMLKAEELAKKADELAKKMGQESFDKIKESESMLEKMEKSELQKAGLEKADMQSVHMSDIDFNQKMDAAKQNAEKANNKVDELKKKLDALKAQLNKPGLDAKAKEELQREISKTEKELAEAMKNAQEAQKDLEAMQLSKEARDVLNKIYNDPLWKQIQEAAQKAQKNAEQSAKTGQPKLSKEERQKLQKEMEELLAKLADDDFRREYLQKLLESIKAGCGT